MDRKFVNLIELDRFKHYSKVMPNHFAHEIMRNIPNEVEKFFELMRFDLDVSQQMIATPMHTQISLPDQMADFSDPKLRATPSSSIVKNELMKMSRRDSFSAMQGEDIDDLNKELEALNCNADSLDESPEEEVVQD